MSDRLGVGAVSRAVNSIHTDQVEALDRRRENLGYDQLGEIEQQFQVPITGTTGAGAVSWTEKEVDFDVDFIDATDQRNSSLTDPHFTFGAVLDNPVIISCCVVQYIDKGDVITGARVSIGAFAPSEVTYSGYVHLSFQGFGAPSEDSADLDADG